MSRTRAAAVRRFVVETDRGSAQSIGTRQVLRARAMRVGVTRQRLNCTIALQGVGAPLRGEAPPGVRRSGVNRLTQTWFIH
jgi:ferric-dicitrate binding protein FerR (iron transport regulator)